MRLFEIIAETEDDSCDFCGGDGYHDELGECPDCGGTGHSGVETELEEVKVTKTLAGKRSTPSRDLAMKNKKKSPNQGKPPVEIHKRRGAKELANIQLKGEY